MSKIYEFIQECNPFFVLTANANMPAGRPFGAIMEIADDLYISTSNKKQVYQDLKLNPKMQIVCLKHGTRDWLRLSAEAFEVYDLAIKDRMLKECPVLYKHYANAEVDYYAVFKLKIIKCEWY